MPLNPRLQRPLVEPHWQPHHHEHQKVHQPVGAAAHHHATTAIPSVTSASLDDGFTGSLRIAGWRWAGATVPPPVIGGAGLKHGGPSSRLSFQLSSRSPLTMTHRNSLTILASINCTWSNPSVVVGQILLPTPNGTILNPRVPVTSVSHPSPPPSSHFGRHFSGFSHTLGSSVTHAV